MTTTTERSDFQVSWDDPADAEHTWRKSGGPLTRLYEDVVARYCAAQRVCWDEVASPMAQNHVVRFVNGFAYNRGPEYDEAARARLQAWGEHLDSLGDRGAWYRDVVRPEVIETIARLKKHPRPTRPLDELVAHLEECMDAYARIMGDLHWRMAAGAASRVSEGKAYDWPEVYEEITGRPGAEGPTLLGGLTNEMTLTVAKLRKLARIVQEEGRDSQRFTRGFRDLLRRYGHRTGAGFGSSVAIGSPTWNVNPEIPMRLIESYARSDLDVIERKEKDAARERKALLRSVRKQLQGDPERLARFEQELEARKLSAWFIEDHNDRMDQSSPGVVRDAAGVVGQRLVRDGVIDDPSDVLHLSLDELRDPPTDARAIVAERKRLHDQRSATGAPDMIGAAAPPEPSIMDRLVDKGEGRVGAELRGIAASSGRYTGRARVCLPSPIPPDVDEGDILVAVDAGPDWTPVFAILGAVVLDRGAAWQHAAVVAREFGVPAVTGTKDGTNTIQEGQMITVDGDTGVVFLA